MTFIFLLIWAGYTVLFGWLLAGFELTLVSTLLWLGTFIFSFILSILTMLVPYTVYGRFGEKDRTMDPKAHRMIDRLLPLIIRLLRLKVHVSGLEKVPKGNFILMGNHQSYYEIIVIKHLITHPMLFIAKRPVFEWPVIGHWANLIGNVPIDKLADRSAAEAIIKGIKQYKKGAIVTIFPEGKRSFSNDMNPMKPGAFKLAMKPKAPIVVFTIHDFYKTWKGWPFRRNHVHVHFHDPIMPEDYKDMNTVELSKRVQRMIEKQLASYETA
ncbi:MAG: 1-acyl-sn-glycerol-3-phosphate acyltransferase [Bacillota bacterium]